jgi:HEAT repeat protein
METMPTPTFPDQPANEPIVTPADAVAAIGRGSYKTQELQALSDLSRADARALADAWPRIPESTRVAVLRRLSELAEENVQFLFGRVFRIGLTDESPVARQISISALWEDESNDLIDLLLGLMQDDPSVDVRAEAASTLARFADLAVIEELDEATAERVRRALFETAQSTAQADLVRRRALESVAVFGGSGGVSELIDEAFDSDDAAMRASAIYAMGRSLDRRWLSTVIAEFESGDAEVRFEAARAGGELGHIDAIPGLSELMLDPDTDVRQAAISALGKIGGPGAVRVLRAYSESSPPADRELVEDALAEAQMQDDVLRGKS